MTYQLKKTNGTILTTIIDGQIDKDSTNLVFIGRNFRGFGEILNENLLKLLENFANPDAPQRPIEGQIWWDNSINRLKIYDGDDWRSIGGAIVQSNMPSLNVGDFWIDTNTRQLYAFDGTESFLIGPDFSQTQGIMGIKGETIQDNQGRDQYVGSLFINNTKVAIISNSEFIPSQPIQSLVTQANPVGRIFKGVNILDKQNFIYGGTADSSKSLIDSSGNTYSPSQIYRKEFNETVSGSLFIQNNLGLKIGTSGNFETKISGNNVLLDSNVSNQDIRVRVKNTASGSNLIDAIHIDSENSKIGIFKSPEYTLDVNGDVRIIGDLKVMGDMTSIEVSTLKVKDKNIELGKTTSGIAGDDDVVDGGGITLTSIDGNKAWEWNKSTNSWTSNVNVDLSDDSFSFKIGGVEKLTNTELKNIEHANDLKTIGTLDFLNIQDLSVENSVISSLSDIKISSKQGIILNSSNDILLQSKVKIKNVEDPTDDSDVATKAYVDSGVNGSTLILSFDITGLGSGTTLYSSLAQYLNDLVAAAPENSGKVAKIHATKYSTANVQNIPVEPFIDKSYIAVDSGGTKNESVVQDFEISPLTSGMIDITAPQRHLIEFISDGSSWVFSNIVNY